MGEGWEPSKKQCSLGNRRAMDRKEPSLRLQNGDNFTFTFTFNSMVAMVNTGFNSPANITATSQIREPATLLLLTSGN
jgi:hypothetical protein